MSPRPRLILSGASPLASSIAALADATGVDPELVDDAVAPDLERLYRWAGVPRDALEWWNDGLGAGFLRWADKELGSARDRVRLVLDALSAEPHFVRSIAEAAWLAKYQPGPAAWNELSALDAPARAPLWLRARLAGQRGRAARAAGLPEVALVNLERNLALVTPGDRVDASLRHEIGKLIREHPTLSGGQERAHRLLVDSLKLHREQANGERGVSMCLIELGKLELDRGDFKAARAYFDECLEHDRTRRSVEGEASTLHAIILLCERTSDVELLRRTKAALDLLQRDGAARSHLQQIENTLLRVEAKLTGGSLSGATLRRRAEAIDDATERAHAVELACTQLRGENRDGEARELLGRELERQPTAKARDHLRLVLVSLLLDARLHEEAEAELGRLETENPDIELRAEFFRCRLLGQRDDPAQLAALDALERRTLAPEMIFNIKMQRARALRRFERPADARVVVAELKTGHMRMDLMIDSALLDAACALELDLASEAESIVRRVLRDYPTLSATRRFEALRTLGGALLELGRFDDAAAVYRLAADATPPRKSRAAILRALIRALTEAGKFDDAIQYCDECEAALDDSVPAAERGWAWLSIARACLRNFAVTEERGRRAVAMAEEEAAEARDAQLQEACAQLRRSARLDPPSGEAQLPFPADPSHPATWLAAARRRRALGDTDGALAAIGVDVVDGMRPRYRRELLLMQATLLLDRRDVAAATRVLDDAVASIVDLEAHLQYRHARMRCALVERRFDEALRLAEALDADAADRGDAESLARARATLIGLHEQQGDAPAAAAVRSELFAYLVEAGRDVLAFDVGYSHLRALIDVGNLDAALHQRAALEPLAARLGVEAQVRMKVADARRLERDEPAAAVQLLDEAAALARTSGLVKQEREVNAHRDRVVLARGSADDARAIAQRGVPGTRGSAVEAATQVQALRRAGHHDDAADAAHRELEIAGTAPSVSRAIALAQLAQALRDRGDLPGAEKAAREAVQLHRDLKRRSGLPQALFVHATVLARSGRSAEARTLATEAKEINQSNGDLVNVQRCDRFLVGLDGNRTDDPVVAAKTLEAGGDVAGAQALRQSARQAAHDAGDAVGAAVAAGAFGISAARRRAWKDAEEPLAWATPVHRTAKTRWRWDCERFLARTLANTGRLPRAIALLQDALRDGPPERAREALQRELDYQLRRMRHDRPR